MYQRFEQYDTLTARELAADNRVPLTAHYASGLLYDLYTLRLLDREDAGGELVYWRI